MNTWASPTLCTHKGKKIVEYALASMDNQLFVSTYMLQLPDKGTLEKFLLDEIENHRDEKKSIIGTVLRGTTNRSALWDACQSKQVLPSVELPLDALIYYGISPQNR